VEEDDLVAEVVVAQVVEVVEGAAAAAVDSVGGDMMKVHLLKLLVSDISDRLFPWFCYWLSDFIYIDTIECGQVMHDCESELVCRWTMTDKVPYFNAGVYLENKRKIGKVDEILGKVSETFFTIKMDPGILSKSFQVNDLVYVGTDKLLPLARFTNPG
jgi:H/ACA ribonucleoprotein complex subunit 1